MTTTSGPGRFLHGLFRVEAALAMAGYTVIACLLIVDVSLRETLETSIYGAQRISVYIMIVTGFLGLGLAAAQGRHLRPRFADGLIPAAFAREVTRLGDLVMTAVFFFFAWLGVRFVLDAHSYGDMAMVIDIPLWILHLIVPWAFASTGLRYFMFALFPRLRPEEVSSE